MGNSTANHRHCRHFLVVAKKTIKVLHNAHQLCLSSMYVLQLGDHGMPVLFHLWKTLAHSRWHVTSRQSIWEARFRHCEVQLLIRAVTHSIDVLNSHSNSTSADYITRCDIKYIYTASQKQLTCYRL